MLVVLRVNDPPCLWGIFLVPGYITTIVTCCVAHLYLANYIRQ